jgi:putative peptidoglycan lipid II flippase
MILVKILAPGFYARQNVVTPVKIGLATLAATQAMNLAFIVPLKHAGLALAIGLGACLNALLLYLYLRKGRIYAPQPGWLAFTGKVALATLVMSGALWLAMGAPERWLQAGWQWRVMMLAGLVLLGLAAYGACLYLMGFRLRDFSHRAAE